jgi:hypothetical protein
MSKQHSLGIDLGTSNSVVTFASAGSEELRVMPVTQILSAGSVGERDLLASALYVAHPSEFSADSLQLPWGESPDGLVGAFAREHGSLIPDRLVTSAKSWLCQHHADRKAAILPWNSDLEEGKVSPFGASRSYLQHLRANVIHHLGPTTPLEDCEVVITVPASFDEVARALTHEAAEAAGFQQPTLLEEPLAAFYAWLAEAGQNWRSQIQPGDIVLVCDLGGGTADFSLVAVAEKDGNLELNRISVGDHILLGGDNMDLALAYTVRAALEAVGTTIDEWQFLALTHGCRVGKEVLLADPDRASYPISVPSRGSSLFAKTVSATLTREQVQLVVLDGFLPLTPLADQPAARQSVGLQEFGLAYASDPVISKHLARFLTRSLANVRSNQDLAAVVGASALNGDFLQPTSILFNGGVFNAPALRERVLALLRSWSKGGAVKELTGGHLDLSVSKGAAHYGRMMLTGEGLRIRAGTARSYYIGLESSMPAVPGFKPPVKAVCVAPQGMEEGTKRALETREFGLVTGEPVTFRFFSSSIRAGDEVGAIVADAERELEETAHLQMTLEAIDGMPEGDVVPVRLHSSVTELGTLELWMHHTDSKNRWKLEFNVRGDEG